MPLHVHIAMPTEGSGEFVTLIGKGKKLGARPTNTREPRVYAKAAKSIARPPLRMHLCDSVERASRTAARLV